MSFRAWVAGLPPADGVVSVSYGPIAEIVLDHPPTRNALSPAMMVELADAVEGVADAAVVILRGAGGSFCSGGNLQAVREHLVRPGGGADLVAFMQATTERLATLGPVVIGVAEGHALGGGAELLTACDFVVAAPDARIGFVQARLGVSPGFGGGVRLVARVGRAAALRLLTGGPVKADEALVLGLVDLVREDALTAARAWAAELAALPPEALTRARRLVDAASRLPRAEALAVERQLFAELWGGPAHLAALDAASRPR